jgi:hypothetical protein
MYTQGGTSFALQRDTISTAGVTTPTIASGMIFWVRFEYEMTTKYS